MSDEAQTRPTIETVLERINALSERIDERFAKLEEELEIRLDRIESEVKLARSESLALRADFREFRAQYKQPA